MSASFPLQRDCDAFYGNPRGAGGAVVNKAWFAANIVYLPAPWKMAMGDIKITKIPVHKKCAEAMNAWFDVVRVNAIKSGKTLDATKMLHLWGMDVFSGSFNYRPMRGLSSLSMHAYGCAIDFDAPRNGLGDTTPNLAKYRDEIITPFLKLGGIWGGDWNGNGSSLDERRADGMHFQFARL